VDESAILEQLQHIDFLLGVLDCSVLFVIGSATAIVVCLILYKILMMCISKF
jgi:hypothetical protein